MNWKLLTVLTCFLLLAAFSMPLVQNTTANPIMPNTLVSNTITSDSKGGSINWRVQVEDAQGRSIAVTSNESYIYVAGARLVNPANSSSWKPSLWKCTTSGSLVWNITIEDIQEYSQFEDVALSPDESSVYATGYYPNGTITFPYPPYTMPLTDAIVVKVDASTGDVGWNYTLNGPSNDRLKAVAVSPDGETVYVAGELSQSSGTLYNSSFYVVALNSSDGSPLWPYELYILDSTGYVQDLEVSPSGDAIYVAGSYWLVGSSDLVLLALNTADGSQIWNITSTMYYSFDGVEVSSDGERIYAMDPFYEHLLTYRSSDALLLQNVSINRKGSHSSTGPLVFTISPDESKVYIPRTYLGVYEVYMLVLVFNLSSGDPISSIKAQNTLTWPNDVVVSGDNVHVYITGSYINVVNGDYRMFLLKGNPEAGVYTLLLPALLYQMLSQNPMNIFLIVAAIASAVVVASIVTVIILVRRGQSI